MTSCTQVGSCPAASVTNVAINQPATVLFHISSPTNNKTDAASEQYLLGYATSTLDDAIGVGVAQTDLEHMVALNPRPVAKVEAVEDLERAALQPIGPAIEDLGAALVDDPGYDAAAHHPIGHHKASWPGANNEDLDVGGCWRGGHVVLGLAVEGLWLDWSRLVS